jgi:hypothetical protein
MGDVARKPLRLGVHDSGEFLGDPGKLAGVGDHHAQESEVFGILVQIQDHARDQTKYVIDVALGLDAGRKGVLVQLASSPRLRSKLGSGADPADPSKRTRCTEPQRVAVRHYGVLLAPQDHIEPQSRKDDAQ